MPKTVWREYLKQRKHTRQKGPAKRQIGKKERDANSQMDKRNRERANRTLQDLELLFKNLPEQDRQKVFTPEKLAKFMGTILKIEIQYTKHQRLPPGLGLGRKRAKGPRGWIQFGGIQRTEDGAPLQSPDVPWKLATTHAILSEICENLSGVKLKKTPPQVICLRSVRETGVFEILFDPQIQVSPSQTVRIGSPPIKRSKPSSK